MSKNIYRCFSLIAFSFLCKGLAWSQSLTLGLNIGYGSYNMESFKQLQEYRMEYAGLPAKVTDNFPANWTSGLEIGLCFQKFPSHLYWFFQFASTGARISSVDYSGELKLDLVTNSYQLGTCIEQDIWRIKFFSLSVSGKVSYLFTEVNTLDYLRIYNQGQKEEYRFTAKGGGLEPGILAGFNVLFFRAGLYGGYLFSFSEGLHLPGEPKAVLKMPDDKDVAPQWSGWRVTLTLDFRIPLKKKS